MYQVWLITGSMDVDLYEVERVSMYQWGVEFDTIDYQPDGDEVPMTRTVPWSRVWEINEVTG